MNLETLHRRAAAELAARDAELHGIDYELELHRVELEMQNRELRQTEQEMLRQLARYETLYDHTPVALLTVDSAGVVTSHNVRAREILGHDADERPLAAFVSRSTADELHRLLADDSWRSAERDLETGDGRRFHMSVRRSESGSVFIAITDVDAAARADQSRFEAWMRVSHDLVMILSADGTIERATPAVERMFGWAPGELDGVKLHALLPEPLGDLIWTNVEEALSRGALKVDGQWGTVSAQRTDGTVVPVRLSLSITRGETGEPSLLAVLTDLTIERKLREQLDGASRNEAIGRLAGNVAHDIKNVLMGVKGCVELARRNVDPASAAASYLDDADNAVWSVSQIANQLFAFATSATVAESLVIDDVIEQQAVVLQSLVGDAHPLGLELEAHDANVRLEASGFEQMLFALLLNVRANSKESGPITVRTRLVSVRSPDESSNTDAATTQYVQLTVRDEHHRYDVVMPTDHEVRGDVPTMELDEFVHEPTAVRQRIALLLVDYPAMVEALAAALSDDGWEVVRASSVSAAQRVIDRLGDRLDVVIADVHLGDAPTRPVVEALRKHNSKPKIVFTSGMERERLVHDGHLDPEVPFIAKPFELDDLRRMIADG